MLGQTKKKSSPTWIQKEKELNPAWRKKDTGHDTTWTRRKMVQNYSPQRGDKVKREKMHRLYAEIVQG